MSIDAFILAGGNSSRMGFDKASLALDGVAVVDRIINALSAVAENVYIAGGEGELSGVKRIPDVVGIGSDRSSLSGLYSSLKHARSNWIAVAACDMPFLTRGLFEKLASKCDDVHAAVIPRDRGGFVQPLCGLYRVEVCIDACLEAIERSDRSVQNMLRRIDTRWVEFDEIADLPGSERFFSNLNTPADIAAAEAIIRTVK